MQVNRMNGHGKGGGHERGGGSLTNGKCRVRILKYLKRPKKVGEGYGLTNLGNEDHEIASAKFIRRLH